MNILLIGYGKMGKTIEKIAIERGHQVVLIIDFGQEDLWQDVPNKAIDVAIEFTQPTAVVNNIKKCLELGIPIVSGTTGWLDQLDEIEETCKKNQGAFFYASNFSIGVNVFFKVNQYLAGLMSRYSEYAIEMEEIHHTEKKDAPSGTAISLAKGVMAEIDGKKGWVNHKSDDPDQIGIVSKRIDQVPGTHRVTYSSKIDEIEIIHTAHSRQGFALGAVLVAEWIPGKKGMLNMDNFLDF